MTAETAAAPKKTRLLNNWLILFLVAMILANIGGQMYGPLMPLYLQDLNATVAQVGLFFTLSRIIPLALQIVGGYISDSLGRLRAIAIASIAGVFTYIALILAPTWQWVLVSAAFSAITYSLIGPSFDAFIAEHSEQHNRARVFAISQTIFGVVMVVGPVMGGWLVDARGFKFMIFIAGLFYLVATVIRVLMAREASKGSESQPKKLSFTGLKTNLGSMLALLTAGGVVTWILITDSVRDMSFNLSFDLLPIYMRDFFAMTTTQIGWVNSIFGLFMMLFMYPAGILSDKKGERVGISLGFFLIAVSISMLALLPNSGLLGRCCRMGHRRDRCGTADPALPVVDQQGGSPPAERRGIRPVQHQRRSFFAACSVHRRHAVGELRSTPAFCHHCRCLPAPDHPGLVEVQD